MNAILIHSEDAKFGDFVGKKLIFLVEEADNSTNARTYYITDSNLKGYDPEFVATVKGKKLIISTGVSNFDGKTKEVLRSIALSQ
jgi:hypothetical protein